MFNSMIFDKYHSSMESDLVFNSMIFDKYHSSMESDLCLIR